MADKSRLGPELTKAEIDALVNTIHGRVVDPGVFHKTIILLGLARYKIITNSVLRASLVIYHFISSAPL